MTDNTPLYQHITAIHERIRREIESHYENYHVTSIDVDTETQYAATPESQAQFKPEYILASVEATFQARACYLNHILDIPGFMMSDGTISIGQVRIGRRGE